MDHVQIICKKQWNNFTHLHTRNLSSESEVCSTLDCHSPFLLKIVSLQLQGDELLGHDVDPVHPQHLLQVSQSVVSDNVLLLLLISPGWWCDLPARPAATTPSWPIHSDLHPASYLTSFVFFQPMINSFHILQIENNSQNTHICHRVAEKNNFESFERLLRFFVCRHRCVCQVLTLYDDSHLYF